MTSLAASSSSGSSTEQEQPQEEHTSDFQKQQPNEGGSETRSNNDDDDNHHDASSVGGGLLGEKSWRSLIEISMAKSRKIRGSNYVQLATVDPDANEPRCRTVVFRGFQKFPDDHALYNGVCDDLSCVLKMCTNSGSRKVSEAAATTTTATAAAEVSSKTSSSGGGAVGEVVWWFAKSSEQYRMRGTLLFVGGGDFPHDKDEFLMQVRKELWGNLSDAARESFLDENVPGKPVLADNNSSKQKIPPGGRDEETGKPVPPPDRFLLMLLFPHHVDYLNLKENYRQIDVMSLDEGGNKGWSFQQVNA